MGVPVVYFIQSLFENILLILPRLATLPSYLLFSNTKASGTALYSFSAEAGWVVWMRWWMLCGGVWCVVYTNTSWVSPSQAASPARKVRVVQGSAVYVVSSVHLLLLPSKPSQTLPGQNYVCQCQLVEELCLTTGEPPVPVKTWLRWHLKFWPGFGSGKHLGRAAGGSEKLNRKHLDSFHWIIHIHIHIL